MSGAWRRFALAMSGLILAAGALLALLFRGPGEAGAIALSGAVAFATQLGAFGLARMLGDNLQARMSTGAMLRLLVLVTWALLAAKVFMLPLVAALVSLAVFFFLTTLLEPLLNRS